VRFWFKPYNAPYRRYARIRLALSEAAMLRTLFKIVTNADPHAVLNYKQSDGEPPSIPHARIGRSVYFSHSFLVVGAALLSGGRFLSGHIGWAFFWLMIAAGGFVLPYFDYLRIRNYLWGRGGQLLAIYWQPLGPGWVGAGGAAIYGIAYLDGQGFVKRASSRTSILAGVYLTEEKLLAARTAANITLMDNRTSCKLWIF
jgi:hypothetical protein